PHGLHRRGPGRAARRPAARQRLRRVPAGHDPGQELPRQLPRLPMNVVTTALEGVVIIEPRVFGDTRGFLSESYHADRYAAAGLPTRFVQDNHSCSAPGTLRGLHYQL